METVLIALVPVAVCVINRNCQVDLPSIYDLCNQPCSCSFRIGGRLYGKKAWSKLFLKSLIFTWSDNFAQFYFDLPDCFTTCWILYHKPQKLLLFKKESHLNLFKIAVGIHDSGNFTPRFIFLCLLKNLADTIGSVYTLTIHMQKDQLM